MWKHTLANRRLPISVAARVTEYERTLIDAAARLRGVTVTQLIRDTLLPEVRNSVRSAIESGSREKTASRRDDARNGPEHVRTILDRVAEEDLHGEAQSAVRRGIDPDPFRGRDPRPAA